MKSFVFLVTSIILIGGISKSQEELNIEGEWFLSEFAHSKTPPPDGCLMLDDDGFIVRDGIYTMSRSRIAERAGAAAGV